MILRARLLLLLPATAVLLGAECNLNGGGGGFTSPHDPLGHELFASPQADPIAVSPDGAFVYVANTTSNTVSVIDAATNQVLIPRIRVGLDPVALGVRPDGNELWVANHVSDSVSVIDTNPASPTAFEVVATIQSVVGGVTDFDEPVGIAFADSTKGYVALSSRNEIAVVTIGAGTYTVGATRLAITAQDPRALAVRGGRLYALAFESGNKSELSVCSFADGTEQCTFDAGTLGGVGADPNLPGVPKNVVRDPDVPDRDLFVFDTTTDTLLESVTNVGTLLYGLAVSSTGEVFVTNTDARNADVDDQGLPDGNGLAAPAPEGNGDTLDDLQNRIFHNRITLVDCTGASCGTPSPASLEEAPGLAVTTPLATPYGIGISGDDSVLVMTAAASNRIASVDAASPGLAGVLDTLDVGDIPRGVAFHSPSGATGTAYVLNTLGNSVDVVDVGAGGALSLVATIPVGDDPTPEDVRLGRIAFNSAEASSSGTFACASCHPDAHTDQLLWFIGATCPTCDQEEPRSTMPVRGLANTLPLHWDGTLGDPFGGPNGEIGVGGNETPLDCSLAAGPQECFRHLVNASLSGVMCDQPGCPTGPSGLAGLLTHDEREDMAVFLQSVSYPPARSRPEDDFVSTSALDGFADFFLDQGGGGGSNARTCADTTGGCHALPLGVSTNSVAVGAFEAPTMRGMTDRFLQFSAGFTAPEEILDIAAFATSQGVIPWDPSVGLDELTVFSAAFPGFNPAYDVFPTDMWQMFEEASVGHSGALGRMVSLSTATATGGAQAATYAQLDELEAADARGVVNVFGHGVNGTTPVGVSYKSDSSLWLVGSTTMTRAALEAAVESGALRFTVTAHLPMSVGAADHPQPLLTVTTVGNGPGGDPDIPILTTGGAGNPMTLVGIDVRQDARILVDGDVDGGSVTCVGGSFTPFCSSQTVEVDLASIPANGLHLLQLQNGNGPLSTELPICVGTLGGCL